LRFGGSTMKLFRPLIQLHVLAEVDGLAEQSKLFGLVDNAIASTESLENFYDDWARRCHRFQVALLIAGVFFFFSWLA
jgi:hypothetical protein